eukprot:CAMPEP_0170592740 /NCGR_PEP_ID=MMETSP0224-20130122/13082_1 /TAXON_ID=285029 /ORGANISM="Togula jolla, Strain CCCM 725" /LENGTH=522 /DNA_ID=CAMNT_0010916659 /DNA_START=60 /DNA_END=1629 /DNA_ORIENTATION=+
MTAKISGKKWDGDGVLLLTLKLKLDQVLRPLDGLAEAMGEPMTSKISGKKWDGDGVPLADSNCAEIGSDADKAARKSAAQTEPAWEGAGSEVGVIVWRIEQFQVVAWPKVDYGVFYSGDSYIILETYKEPDSPKLLHNIYFWLGEKTTTDEMGTAAYKTVELDDLLDGEPTQHREVQGYESAQFKKLFKSLFYKEGGVDSGFRHVGEAAYQARLIQVRKTAVGGLRTKEVSVTRDSLNQGDCFILDAGTSIYVWCGSNAQAVEKACANTAAENIESKRDGKATVTHDIDERFWELLGGEGPIKDAAEGTDDIPEPTVGEGVLYVLSDTTGDLKTTEVARGDLGESMLDSSNVMMLDTGSEVFLWVGKDASPGEGRNAMATAMNFLKTNGKPTTTPIHLYKEGTAINNAIWKEIFKSGPSKPPAPKAAEAPAPAPAPAAAAAPATAPAAPAAPAAAVGSFTGTLSLEDLQDSRVWHSKGLDPTKREQYLEDAEFSKVFNMSKAEFAKLPKWKQDGEKKKHQLF